MVGMLAQLSSGAGNSDRENWPACPLPPGRFARFRRVRNIVDYGAYIDLGCIDGLLHLDRIPGVINGLVGETLTKGEKFEVEVLNIYIEQQRISLGIPMDDT